MSLLFTRREVWTRGLAFIALVLIAVLGMVPVLEDVAWSLRPLFRNGTDRGVRRAHRSIVYQAVRRRVDPELSKRQLPNTPAIGTLERITSVADLV